MGGIGDGSGSYSRAAMQTSGSSNLTIYAGTFQGGVYSSGSTQIFGGSFQGVIPNGSQPVDRGIAFRGLGGNLSIAGGTFQGGGGSAAGSVGLWLRCIDK